MLYGKKNKQCRPSIIMVVSSNMGANMTIRSFQEISTQWIEGILKADSGTISEFSLVSNWNTPVSQIALLDIKYKTNGNSLPSSLFIKVSANPPKEMAGFGEKEIQFYNKVVPMKNMRCFPHSYYASYDAGEKVYNLVLENLNNTHFQNEWPIPPLIKYCTMAVKCLAKVHAYWWDNSSLQMVTNKFGSRESILPWIEQLEKLSIGFIDFLGDRITEKRKRIIKSVTENFERYSARFLSYRNLTLVHGDAHFWNFLFPKDDDHDVKIIDWQSYGHGVPTDDLAYMIALHWYPDRRKEYEQDLLNVYHKALLDSSVRDYSFEQLMQDYKWSVIQTLAVPIWQWNNKSWASIWFNHLERILLAYEDLYCASL
jgi:thiamine kinase-like enzyme